MVNNRWLGHLSYIVVGVLSLLFAIFLASRFVRTSFSQTITEPATPIEQTQSNQPAVPTDPEQALATPPPPAQTAVTDDVSFLEPYVFDLREGRRNPFRPPQLDDGSTPDLVLPGTPLERYELDELRLVGIMWDVRAPKAMFIDPHGEVHILGKDDRIGRKRGYIAVIREGEVVVVETTNFSGENAYSTRVLRIEKK